MDKNIETLRFRTKWLSNTVKIMKTSCKNYHADTVVKIEQLAATQKNIKN